MIRHTAVYGLGLAVNQLSGLVLTPIYTRVFPREAFGAIDLISVTATIAILVLSLGLDSALSRFYYEERDQASRRVLVSTVVITVLGLAVPATIVIVWLSPTLSTRLFGSAAYASALALSFARLPFVLLLQLVLFVQRLSEQPWRYSALSFGNLISTVVLSIVLVVYLHKGVNGVFLAQLVTVVIVSLIGLFLVRVQVGLVFGVDRLTSLLAYGLPLVPAMVSGWVLQYTGRLVVPQLLGLEQLADYALAAKIATIMTLGATAFNLAWGPFAMSILHTPEAKEVYAKIFSYYLVVASILGGALTIFAPEIIRILSRPGYEGAAAPVGLLVGSVIIYQSWNMLNLGVSVAKRTYFNIVTIGLGGGVTLLGNLVLVPRYGLVGAALATVVGYAIAAAAIVAISHWLYPIRYQVGRIARAVTLYAALVVVALMLPWPPSFVSGLVWHTLLMAVFLGLMLMLVVDRSEIAQLLTQLIRQDSDAVGGTSSPGRAG